MQGFRPASRHARASAAVNAAGVSAKPQHPNAAKLFYGYLLSKPAQPRLRALRRIPAREQSKLKLAVEPSQTGAQLHQTIKEFREIFGL
ncbi:MAG TPA: hypothetical protein VNN13_11410 [Methylomirabilota bacterium]|nr:hypothetical protein [Methylomirabilota bacterium]